MTFERDCRTCALVAAMRFKTGARWPSGDLLEDFDTPCCLCGRIRGAHNPDHPHTRGIGDCTGFDDDISPIHSEIRDIEMSLR